MEEQEFVLKIKEYIRSKLKIKDEQENNENIKDLNSEFTLADYAEWIDKVAKNSNSICIITHPIKFTNSEIKNPNIKNTSLDILARENYNTSESSPYLVNTLNLRDINFDLYCNAAYLGFAGFFLIRNPENNNYLINEVISGKTNFLSAFSKDKEKVLEWVSCFKETVKEKKYLSHAFAKQTYFPISAYEYRLVSPLTASSLYHKIYEKIWHSRYSEESKNLRGKRKNSEYSEQVITEFRGLTEMKFGGTKPQNISYLNSLRSGKVLLLNSAPPQWNKSKSKKHITFKNFWKEFESISYKKLNAYKKYLLTVKKSNYEVRKESEFYLYEIIDSLLFYLINLKNDSISYTLDNSIKDSYLNTYLFDKKENLNSHEIENFVENISNEFSFKVVKKLSSDKLLFSNDEYALINKLVKNEILELIKNS